jgi:amidase
MLTAGKLRAAYEQPQLRAQMKPEALWEVEQSLALTGTQVYEASRQRTQVYQALRGLFERYDYVVAPAAQVFPFPAEQHWPKEVAGVAMDTYHRWMEVVTPFTLAGLPVASVPVGFGANGLPMGMQVAGPPRADLRVLALARACEQVAPWSNARPPALAHPA